MASLFLEIICPGLRVLAGFLSFTWLSDDAKSACKEASWFVLPSCMFNKGNISSKEARQGHL